MLGCASLLRRLSRYMQGSYLKHKKNEHSCIYVCSMRIQTILGRGVPILVANFGPPRPIFTQDQILYDGLNGWGRYGKVSYCFGEICSKHWSSFLRYCEVNFSSYSAHTEQIADKNVVYCSSFNALSVDTSFIKI